MGYVAFVRFGCEDSTGFNCDKWTRYSGAHLLGELPTLENSASELRCKADLYRKLLQSYDSFPNRHPPSAYRQRVSSNFKYKANLDS